MNKLLFLIAVLLTASFSFADSLTFIPQTTKNIAIGSEVYDFGYFPVAVADISTKTGGITTAGMLYFDPFTSCGTCSDSPSTTPLGFGWETADIFNGYVEAGNWTFNAAMKLSNAQTAKVGFVGVNVFKQCNGVFTRLFYAQSTMNVLNSTLATNPFLVSFSTSQPLVELQSECRIYVGYWLNTTTGLQAGGNRIDLQIGTSPNQTNVSLPNIQHSFFFNTTELIGYLTVIGNNTYSLNSSVAYFNSTIADLDNETDMISNQTGYISGFMSGLNATTTATHADTQSVLTILDSLNVSLLNASINQLIAQTYVIENYLDFIQNQTVSIAGNVSLLFNQIVNLTGMVQTLNLTNDIIVINQSLNSINATSNNIQSYSTYSVKAAAQRKPVVCIPFTSTCIYQWWSTG